MCLISTPELAEELKKLKKDKKEIILWKGLCKRLAYTHNFYKSEYYLVSPYYRTYKWKPGLHKVSYNEIRKDSINIDENKEYNYGFHFYKSYQKVSASLIGFTNLVKFTVPTKSIVALGDDGDVVSARCYLDEKDYKKAMK